MESSLEGVVASVLVDMEGYVTGVTSGNTMTITTTNDEVDYDAGNAVYTGYTLDGTTYEVTRNGYATQSHSFTC